MRTSIWMKLMAWPAMALLLAFAGCTGSGRPIGSAREVSPAAFASAENRAVEPAETDRDSSAEESTAEPADDGRPITLGAGPTNVQGDQAAGAGRPGGRVPGASASGVNRPVAVGEPVLVERMVGQVNGRPVFADEFFEPIAAELTAEGRQLPPSQFVAKAEEIVGMRLQQVVLNELLLAEAESGLSEQEQMGLLAWLQGERESLFAEIGGGSREVTETRLQEEEQVTVEEYIQGYRDQELIRSLLGQKVMPRVIVSWRDVQREYERRDRATNEFNPPPSWTLSRIMLSTKSRADDIEQVKEQLAVGVPFAEVAEFAGMRDRGEWGTFKLGELAETIRNHVKSLAAGQTSEPFQMGSMTAWMHVDEIQRPEGRSIYDVDVQRALIGSLRRERFAAEQDRYVQSLFEEGILDQISLMQQRLLEMAYLRYGP